MKDKTLRGVLLSLFALSGGCRDVWGFQEPILLDLSAGGSGGGTSGIICVPGTVIECDYSGPNGTKDVGTCKAGTKPCLSDGLSYGACSGEVTPKSEDCTTGSDENCDGQVNEAAAGCVCTPNAITACYTGPEGTAGVGICKTGKGLCNGEGTGYGSCDGEVKPAAEDCASPTDENCDTYDCVEHSALYGDADAQGPSAVAVDRQDNSYYVVGQLHGTMIVQGTNLSEIGQGEAFLLKFDANDSLVWAKQFGDASNQQATSVAVDKDGNVALVGISGGTITWDGTTTPYGLFVALLTKDGNTIWAKSIGGASNSAVTSVAFTPQGDVLCGGYFLGELDFGDGPISANAGLLADGTDGFVAKMRAKDGSANTADGGWVKTFGDEDLQATRAVRADGQGNILVAGDFGGSLSLGGTALSSSGYRDVFLAKLAADGSLVWQMRLGDPKNQEATGLAVDSTGAVIVTGTFEGTVDFVSDMLSAPANGARLFAAKYTSSKFPEWSKAFGTAGTANVAFDPDDNVLLAGGFAGSLDLGGTVLNSQGTDIFLAKLKSSGAFVWNKRFGDDAVQRAVGIDAASTGESVVVGIANGSVDFGMGPLMAKGTDVFIARFAP